MPTKTVAAPAAPTPNSPASPPVGQTRETLLDLIDNLGKIHSRLLDIRRAASWKPGDASDLKWRKAFSAVNSALGSASLALDTHIADVAAAAVSGLEAKTAEIRDKIDSLKKVSAVINQIASALDLFKSIVTLFTR
jgi:hypothetical protein